MRWGKEDGEERGEAARSNRIEGQKEGKYEKEEN
jgi:hypothetical protein